MSTISNFKSKGLSGWDRLPLVVVGCVMIMIVTANFCKHYYNLTRFLNVFWVGHGMIGCVSYLKVKEWFAFK